MAQRPAPGGRDSRPHHISSIVHHFFDEESGPDAEARHRRRELAVCGPGTGPLAAWVCAGVARSLARESLILSESTWLTWSATSYLAAPMLQLLADPGHRQRPREGEHRFWQVGQPEDPPTEIRKQGLDPAGRARIMLRHLGNLTPRHLDDLEAVHLGSQPTPAALPGQDALIWCLDRRDASSLEAAYTLGRVLALLRPDHLEVLVVDPEVLPSDRSLARHRDGEELLNRCRLLVAAAGRSGSSHVCHLRGSPRTPGEMAGPTFDQLAGRVLDGHDYD